MAVWQNYVTTVVQRYKGRISSYEVWNEPVDPHYWTGTPEMMGRLTQVAGRAIHAADPRATVVSGAAYTKKDNSWWRRYLSSGIAQDVDVIGVHLYSRAPEDDVAGFDTMKEILVSLKLDKKPVWNTETGFINEHQPYTLDQARGTVLRAHLLFAGAGLKRFYWYAWDNQVWVGLKLTASDRRTLTVAGVAYQQSLTALMGVTVTSCVSTRLDTSWCDVRRGTARSRYYWAPMSPKALALPVGTTGYQHLGGRWVGARAGQVIVLNGEPIQVTLRG